MTNAIGKLYFRVDSYMFKHSAAAGRTTLRVNKLFEN